MCFDIVGRYLFRYRLKALTDTLMSL